jgi:hypothetical protein
MTFNVYLEILVALTRDGLHPQAGKEIWWKHPVSLGGWVDWQLETTFWQTLAERRRRRGPVCRAGMQLIANCNILQLLQLLQIVNYCNIIANFSIYCNIIANFSNYCSLIATARLYCNDCNIVHHIFLPSNIYWILFISLLRRLLRSFWR